MIRRSLCRGLKLSTRPELREAGEDLGSGLVPYLHSSSDEMKLNSNLPNNFKNLTIELERVVHTANLNEEMTEIEQLKKMAPKRREFLIAGKSNVGKSSLINTFLGDKVARVSNTPVGLLSDSREKRDNCSSISCSSSIIW